MKKSFLVTILAAVLVVGAAGCGAQKPVETVSSSSLSEQEELGDGEIEIVDETQADGAATTENAGNAGEPTQKGLAAEGAKLYRGIVEEFAVDDVSGNTVLSLFQADGTDFGYPTLKVMLTDTTKFPEMKPQFGNGSYLEVYFDETAKNADGSVSALTVSELDSPDSILFNGRVAEITPSEEAGKGDILVDPMEDGGMQYLFHYDENTEFTLDMNSLQAGDEINVVHSPIATRSIPPQSMALEIHAYVKGAAGPEAILLG